MIKDDERLVDVLCFFKSPWAREISSPKITCN
jgi:hypothetical protein